MRICHWLSPLTFLLGPGKILPQSLDALIRQALQNKHVILPIKHLESRDYIQILVRSLVAVNSEIDVTFSFHIDSRMYEAQ